MRGRPTPDARAFVGPGRASSVFPTPPRASLEARTFAEANEIARTISGKGISQQAFALGKKILEVHAFAEVDERVIEMHPEVLSGSWPVRCSPSRSTPTRVLERPAWRSSSSAGIVLPGAVPGVPEVDLLDAAAGAWTAARYSRGDAQAFPPEHSRPPRRNLGVITRLASEQRDGLDVRGVREHVDRTRADELVAVLPRSTFTSGERRRVAGDVDEPWGLEGAGAPQRLAGEPRARRVDDDDVRRPARSASSSIDWPTLPAKKAAFVISFRSMLSSAHATDSSEISTPQTVRAFRAMASPIVPVPQ